MRISFTRNMVGSVPNPWQLGTSHRIRQGVPQPVIPVTKAVPVMRASSQQHEPTNTGIRIDFPELLDYASQSPMLVSPSHIPEIIYTSLSPAEQKQMDNGISTFLACQKVEERKTTAYGVFEWTNGVLWTLKNEYFDKLRCPAGPKLIINCFNATGLPRDAMEIAGTISQFLRQIIKKQS